MENILEPRQASRTNGCAPEATLPPAPSGEWTNPYAEAFARYMSSEGKRRVLPQDRRLDDLKQDAKPIDLKDFTWRPSSSNPFDRNRMKPDEKREDATESYWKLKERFGPTFLSDEAIAHILECTVSCDHRIVSPCSGLAYTHRQLHESGCDVLAFDANVRDNAFFKVVEGSPVDASAHSDRALYLCHPWEDTECGTQAIKKYAENGGKIIIVDGIWLGHVSHVQGMNAGIMQLLSCCKRLIDHREPEWRIPGNIFSTEAPELDTLPFRLRIFDCSPLTR